LGALRRSYGTNKAEAFVATLKAETYRARFLGIEPKRTWQEAVVRYLAIKARLRDAEKQRQICRKLNPYLGKLTLNDITGDVI
jgi:hypothetical protein